MTKSLSLSHSLSAIYSIIVDYSFKVTAAIGQTEYVYWLTTLFAVDSSENPSKSADLLSFMTVTSSSWEQKQTKIIPSRASSPRSLLPPPKVTIIE